MKTICICGYKGKSFFPSLLIEWVTWSPYSHIALMFPDIEGIVIEAWSSGGVQKSPSLATLHAPGTVVDVKTITVSDEQHADILSAATKQIHKKYDFLGVARFLPRIRLFIGGKPSHSEQGKWFCSELAAYALLKGSVKLLDVEPYKQSPADVMASPLPMYKASFICGVEDYSEFLKKVRSV